MNKAWTDMETKDQESGFLRECLRLMRKPPDEKLLRRYYETSVLGLPHRDPLTSQELKWVRANLAGNRKWQQSFERLNRHRAAIRISRSLSIRYLAAAVIALAAPVWIFALFTAGGPSERALHVVHGDAENVIRGDSKPELRLPEGFSPFIVPSWRTLRDLQTNSRNASQLMELREDLIDQYETTSDRIERAEIAFVVSQLNLELQDLEGVETWRDRCRREQVFDCTGSRLEY